MDAIRAIAKDAEAIVGAGTVLNPQQLAGGDGSGREVYD